MLPKGRKAFSFDSEAAANAYGEQWNVMKMAGIAPPAELLNSSAGLSKTLAHVIGRWEDGGGPAPTGKSTISSLVSEVGHVKLVDATYTWLTEYLRYLKVEKHLAPSTIRHRIQSLNRAIEDYLRHNRDVVFLNPISLLERGYSTYSDIDKKLLEAKGKKAKLDVSRDRRLHPGEEDRIVEVLSGKQRDDRERGLLLQGGNALLTMFLLIVNSGLRLREAYRLRRNQVDLDNKLMHVQCSKQWRGKIIYRDVPMRPEVHRALVAYLSTRPLMPDAYLFPFMEEEPDLTLKKVTQRLSDRFSSAFDYAGIDALWEHDLRHEATCRWLELKDARGQWLYRLEEINKIMGWAPNSLMAQRYASFRAVDLAKRMWEVSEAA
jgi:integrase